MAEHRNGGSKVIVIWALVLTGLGALGIYSYNLAFVQRHSDYVYFSESDQVRLYRLYYRPTTGFHGFVGPAIDPALRVMNHEIRGKYMSEGTTEWKMYLKAAEYANLHHIKYDNIMMIKQGDSFSTQFKLMGRVVGESISLSMP